MWNFEEVRGKRNGPERVNGEIEVYKADIETPSTVKFAGEELVKGRTGCHDSSPLFFFANFSPPFLSGGRPLTTYLDSNFSFFHHNLHFSFFFVKL